MTKMSALTIERPGRVEDRIVAQARAVDLLSLAEARTQLRGTTEKYGACPKCGGSKRFHVNIKRNEFFCRDCRKVEEHGWGNPITFLMWLDGCDFRTAVSILTNGSIITAKPRQGTPQPRQRAAQPQEWRHDAERVHQRAQALLWEPAGAAAQEYLLDRGLEPHTWKAFGLGYKPNVFVPGTNEVPEYAPAISIPWVSKRQIVAIRYRFLKVHNGSKQTSLRGSNFAGHLFGAQALMGCAERFRWLSIEEGEINAMSCWQSSFESGMDALSIGSENGGLTAEQIAYTQRYMGVATWADKESAAQKLMSKIPNAIGIKSPGGKDANDMLQEGTLGGFLAGKRERWAESDADREALLWALYDAAMLPNGITTGEATVLQNLAKHLGKKAAIYEASPGRWITSFIPRS